MMGFESNFIKDGKIPELFAQTVWDSACAYLKQVSKHQMNTNKPRVTKIAQYKYSQSWSELSVFIQLNSVFPKNF